MFGTINKAGSNFRSLSTDRKGPITMSDHFKTHAAQEQIILELTEPSLPKAEASLIHKVLEEKNWNLKQAARELNIARSTLYSKMKKHHIERPAL